MAVLRCEQGHFYDGDKFEECPHCKNALPSRRRLGEALTEMRPHSPTPAAGVAPRVQVQLGAAGPADEKTVGIYRAKLGRDPVVGWLVCMQGAEAGRDYRLHAGRNSVGRAMQMDVCLPDEARISRQDHCFIIYEPMQAVFVLVRGQGEEVLVNGQPLADSCPLNGDETITLGASTFVFIPFCRKGRIW